MSETKVLDLSENSKEILVKQLNYWIEQNEKISNSFNLDESEIGAINSQYFNGMAQAYWNIKQFVEVNS